MHRLLQRALYVFLAGVLLTGLPYVLAAQEKPPSPPVPGPMLDQGYLDFDTPEFSLRLVRSSHTVAALKPKIVGDFDFTPGDMLVARSRDGFYHLGDLDVRVRKGTSGAWRGYSTAVSRKPVTALPASGSVLAAADLKPTLPQEFPLAITRLWAVEGGKLVLRFVFKNETNETVQVGALGIPMAFNNIINGRSLEEAHAKCSFADPYIGEDAGYLQVTRLSGNGPALLVVPDGETPFEAYNPIGSPKKNGDLLFTEATPRGMTFEGFFDWMVHSQAYAEEEWKDAKQWNPPTLLTLKPGESRTYGVKFLLADSIRHIEATLEANHRPVAIGVPGYILPSDIDGRLFLNYSKPVKSIAVEPAGALDVRADAPTNSGWQTYSVRGKNWGRVRLTIQYADSLSQTIQYFVTKPAQAAVADLGHFLTTKQWFVNPTDSFHRSPSAMSYDRELDKIVDQDSRVWIAGLGDEGGSGSWIAAFMKELGQPDKQEIDKLQDFVDQVLWGGLQYKEGPHAYGVRKSLFYYEPSELPAKFYRADLNWKSWTSWNKQASMSVERTFNYPHVVAAYWVFYRLSRNNPGLIVNHTWDWYLHQAYETSMAMVNLAPGYLEAGLMEGNIFVQLLTDLKREGMNKEAARLETEMKKRADRWRQEAYPFGSEMPWDSTGQEEVYAWTKYFGHDDKAQVTLNAILGYDPAIPHWGYNGSARRFWDFLYGGKYSRLERQLHHYGSALNSIPLLAEYREHPDDLHLLRVGYGGTMGAISNIDQEGFASAAFHSFPDMLRFDPLSGDYGPNFFGHAWNTATYLVNTPEFGWLSFGGNLKQRGKTVKVTPLDSFRSRFYVAPAGLWLTLDAGKIETVEFDSESGRVRIGLEAATKYTPFAYLRIEQPVKARAKYIPAQQHALERDTYKIALNGSITWVELAPEQKQ